MPWINLTLRRGAFTKTVQHAVMAKLTDALIFWEKIPDTPEARKKTMGGFMKSLRTPTTTVALLTTKILFISLRCACLPAGLTRLPNNISSGISRRLLCSPRARPISRKTPTGYGCTSSNSRLKTGASEDIPIGFATTRAR
jgi:hypothetical protein